MVLEYCKGGDLSMFIQRHGKIPDATAKHFMQQLGNILQKDCLVSTLLQLHSHS